MNVTGTASHFNKTADTKAITIKMICGKLFFTEKFLNLNAITGMLLTIKKLNTIMSAYNTQLLMSQLLILIAPLPKCNMSGNDATNKPTAGVGTPLNAYFCESSKLNFASRYAAAQLRMNAGNNNNVETSNPFSSRA